MAWKHLLQNKMISEDTISMKFYLKMLKYIRTFLGENSNKIVLKYFILFAIGGITYFLMEVMSRGFSHWSMAFVGGIAFIACGLINEILKWETPLWKQSIIGGLLITLMELISGIIINIIFKWDIWDYSDFKFNFLGQICLRYSLIWCLLAVIAIVVDDYLRYWLFGEEKPRYKFL